MGLRISRSRNTKCSVLRLGLVHWKGREKRVTGCRPQMSPDLPLPLSYRACFLISGRYFSYTSTPSYLHPHDSNASFKSWLKYLLPTEAYSHSQCSSSNPTGNLLCSYTFCLELNKFLIFCMISTCLLYSLSLPLINECNLANYFVVCILT
jgi:hypothetical protein